MARNGRFISPLTHGKIGNPVVDEILNPYTPNVNYTAYGGGEVTVSFTHIPDEVWDDIQEKFGDRITIITEPELDEPFEDEEEAVEDSDDEEETPPTPDERDGWTLKKLGRLNTTKLKELASEKKISLKGADSNGVRAEMIWEALNTN